MAPRKFTDSVWNELATSTAAAFSLSKDKATVLINNSTAKLIAAIPFVAGCEHPDRTALSHLATFIMASAESCKKVFDHDPSDNLSPTARLTPIADFEGGDKAVLTEGMNRLALIMVNGYKKDLEKDKQSGEYNPILAKSWDYEAIVARLSVGKVPSPLDSIIPAEAVTKTFWQID